MSESVLVVEEDPLVRSLLGNALSSQLPQACVTLLGQGDEALASMARQVYDLALVDAAVRAGAGEDGPLWQRLAEEHPHLPVLLLGSRREGDPPLPPNALLFPRPLPVEAVVGKVIQALTEWASGELHGIGLAAFLQLVEVERKTCTVLVRDEDRGGSFVFDRGLLIHARQGDLVGEAAAMEMLGWPRPHLAVREATAPPANVTMRLSQLILEAFRLLDERTMSAISGRPGGAPGELGAPGESGASGEPCEDESDEDASVPPCTAEERLSLAPGVVYGLVLRRRSGRILLAAGDTTAWDAPRFARAAARAYEAATVGTALARLADVVSGTTDRWMLLWPSASASTTLILLVMKRSRAAFALAAQRLRLRGW